MQTEIKSLLHGISVQDEEYSEGEEELEENFEVDINSEKPQLSGALGTIQTLQGASSFSVEKFKTIDTCLESLGSTKNFQSTTNIQIQDDKKGASPVFAQNQTVNSAAADQDQYISTPKKEKRDAHLLHNLTPTGYHNNSKSKQTLHAEEHPGSEI